MNIWANAVITNKGLALLAKLTQGNTLEITDAVTGAGFVTPGLLSNQTEVSEPKQALTFKTVSYPEVGKCALPMSLTNEGMMEGYEATQIGVYATDPDEGRILFFIAQAADADNGTIIPNETEMPGYSAEWTFYFQYGQADGVNLTVDPSNTVSRAEMEAYFQTHQPALSSIPIVSVTGSGTAYTGNIPDLTALEKGLVITIIPDTTSSTTIPTLNLNSLGTKNIKQKLSINTSLTAAAENSTWMVANKPVTLLFDGTQWVTMAPRSSADDLYGTVPVSKGGTDATDAATALTNLGITAGTTDITAGSDALATGAYYDVYE